MGHPSSTFGPRARRRGIVPPWVTLLILSTALILIVRGLGASAEAHGVAEIDARRFRLHAGTRWVHPAWQEQVASVLLRVGSLSANDSAGIEWLVGELGRLSFVAEVGAPEVLWPDGLSVPLRLRQPVACVPVGDGFLAVSEDGVLLTGFSFGPQEVEDAWLPVLRLSGADDAGRRPGDRLEHVAERRALAVAHSMHESLSVEVRRELGRVLIDATRAEGPDGLPGGVVIDLEGRRRILFGRAPGEGIPGELPVELKWRNVLEGVEQLRLGEDWAILDARFDAPTYTYREPTAAAQGM